MSRASKGLRLAPPQVALAACVAALAACQIRRSRPAPMGCGTEPGPGALRWHPSSAAALGALKFPTVAEVPADARALEVDGDGLPDAMFWRMGGGCAPGCLVLRHSPAGWSAEDLSGGVHSNDARSATCRGPVTAAGRVLVASSAQGCRDVPGTPGAMSCWRKTVVWAARPGQPFRAVYFGQQGADEVWDLGARSDGSVTLVASAGLHEGVEAPQHAVLTWNAERTALQPASCWQRLEPARTPAPVARCAASLSAPFDLWAYDSSPYPAHVNGLGYRFEVIAPASPRRGASRMFCVRVTSLLDDPRYGYVYLRPDQLAGCPAFPP